MDTAFYVTAFVSVVSSLMVITRRHAIHALLYLVVSLLATGVIFFILGAPFAAALQVIVYAGAIMVLFVFVVMILNLDQSARQERHWLKPRIWVVPVILTIILGGELIYVLGLPNGPGTPVVVVTPKEVGMSLFGPYLIGVELASFLLLAGLVGAYHLAHDMAVPGDDKTKDRGKG
jgi:NADH-quinone oxidoreductase subunit J